MTSGAAEMITKLRAAKTKPEVDALRAPFVEMIPSMDKSTFERVQGELRKAINRYRRVPLKDRTW